MSICNVKEASFTLESTVRGYHMYKDIREASVGQSLPCWKEGSNLHDPYAVVVLERGVLVGHVPRAISTICYFV